MIIVGSRLVEANPDADGNLIGGVGGGTIDPQLTGLERLGGTTPIHGLFTTSPAVDAGRLVLGMPMVEQRGVSFSRNDGLAPDIGAYESQVSTYVVSLFNDEQDGDISAGEMSLREAVAIANLNPGPDQITFIQVGESPPISLPHGELTITDSVEINGSLDSLWRASIENFSGRVFRIESPDADIHVDLVRIIVTGHAGFVSGNQEGGAIRSTERLRLEEVAVGSGRAARGGGIYQTDAPLSVIDSYIRSNWAMEGAGIYLTSSATVDNTRNSVSIESSENSSWRRDLERRRSRSLRLDFCGQRRRGKWRCDSLRGRVTGSEYVVR